MLGMLISCHGAVGRYLTRSSGRKEAFRLTVWENFPSWWGKQIGDTPIYSDKVSSLILADL